MKTILEAMENDHPIIKRFIEDADILLYKYNTSKNPDWQQYAKDLIALQEKYRVALSRIIKG